MLPGELMLHVPGTEILHRCTSRNGILSLVTSPAHLSAAAMALTGRPIDIASDRIVRPPAAARERFLSLAERAGQMMQTTARAPPGEEAARSFTEAMTRAMVGCLAGSRSQSRPVSAGPRVRTMAELISAPEGDFDHTRHLTDLCRALGVSGRILRQYCQEFLGMSPYRFLTLRRLHLARRALLHADPAITNVTALAAEFGFWELGRFAVTYRRAFGESPSVTLRRFGTAPGPGVFISAPQG